MQPPIVIPLALLVAAALAPLLASWRPNLAFPVAVVAIGVSAAAAVVALAETITGPALHYYLGGWPPPLGIEYLLDEVGAFASVVVTVIALLVIIGTRRVAAAEFPDRLGLFYSLVLLVLGGLTGIIITHDLFNLFVFMEISSLSAYALVFMGGGRGMMAGLRYLILGTIGGSFFLLGVGFLYFSTGTLNMTDISGLLTEIQDSRAVLAGAVFIFTGLGLKMALFPLHLWLPDAYTHSPSSVNTLLAPIMTKVSAIAMIRMVLSVFPAGYLTEVVPIAATLTVLGIAGMILGSAAAVWQTDYRRMLAHSSVGQLGLIGAAIGLASPAGVAVALLHIMSHAIMKGCLFMVAANVRFRTGRSDIDGMTGLGRSMPLTMGAFSVAALAMVGVPPLAGFFSKFYLAEAGISAGNWPVAVAVLASSLLTATYLFRVVEKAYLSAPAGAAAHAAPPSGAQHDQAAAGDAPPSVREAPTDMLLPALLMAAAAIVVGLLNTVIMTEVLEPGVFMWMGA
ncbi:MAG: complex I subunit 5 family protein [Chloroflexota bacterium]